MASALAQGTVSGAIPASLPLFFPAAHEERGFMSAMVGCSSSSLEVNVFWCSHHLLQPQLPEDSLRPQQRLGAHGVSGRWMWRCQWALDVEVNGFHVPPPALEDTQLRPLQCPCSLHTARVLLGVTALVLEITPGLG